jgi:hypothetical protein
MPISGILVIVESDWRFRDLENNSSLPSKRLLSEWRFVLKNSGFDLMKYRTFLNNNAMSDRNTAEKHHIFVCRRDANEPTLDFDQRNLSVEKLTGLTGKYAKPQLWIADDFVVQDSQASGSKDSMSTFSDTKRRRDEQFPNMKPTTSSDDFLPVAIVGGYDSYNAELHRNDLFIT